MKKNNIKKILLYISIVPYIYVLFMSIYHAIFGYDHGLAALKPDYGIEGAFHFISNFWEDNFAFSFIILAVSVSYQIYYFCSSKRIEKNTTTNKTKRINIQKVLFVISILCWLAYFMLGIHAFLFGIELGLFNSVREVYGMEALVGALRWYGFFFSFIPVLPITLIYIVIYLIIKIKDKRHLEK